MTKKGVILKIRNSKTFKGLCVCFSLNILFEVAYPSYSLALTEGPSQPEVQSFEPINTNQMVDLFSGDFNYNIPLFNLPGPNGGYPVNLAYHAGVSMDDEASWVGLGWNINVGSLNRNVRGLPDEFLSTIDNDNQAEENSDFYQIQYDIKENRTFGGSYNRKFEILGGELPDGTTFTNNIGFSLSIYHNNYNGMGAGVDLSYSYNSSPYSFSLSLDNENGLGVGASLSWKSRFSEGNTDYINNIGFKYDGKLSLATSLNLNYEQTHDKSFLRSLGYKVRDYTEKGGGSIGSGSITFARNVFSPSIANKLTSYSLSASFSGGNINAPTFFKKNGFSIFYNTQDLSNKEKNTGIRRPVVGYAKNGTEPNSEYFTKDFSRSNDGQITKANAVLPHSNYTYDIYSSTGQGLAGYFRPRRNDVGRVHDPFIRNLTFGGSVAFEFATGVGTKLGVDGGVNFGWDTQGAWDNKNDMPLPFKNQDDFVNQNNEILYYQAHGESTIIDASELDYIGGLGLTKIKFRDRSSDNSTVGKRKIESIAEMQSGGNTNRKVRNTMINALTNREVAKLGEFKINHFTNHSLALNNLPTVPLNRSLRGSKNTNIGGHPGGYKVLNQDGTYYNYCLPAYNLTEIEHQYSVAKPNNPAQQHKIEYPNSLEPEHKVSGTHKFKSKTTKSPYAHSYLLTSVQGADYVDLTNNGPSDDDLGYWVKFNYIQYATDYKWRAPFTGANYNRGAVYTDEDDKASYQYGVKELWYMGQIETKSHIAVFKLAERSDNKEAANEYPTLGSKGSKSGLYVQEIHVYDKKSFLISGSNTVPLQTIYFDYDYHLTKTSPNSNAGTGGKLTLKKLWFTSNGSTRGSLSKYEFDYSQENLPADLVQYENPNYKENTYDSWGLYKPISTNYEHHSTFPYTNQFNQDWPSGVWEPNYGNNLANAANRQKTKDVQDQLASAWCLKSIKLPSGGKINIQYESDDYGYVQHKTANQMFKISRLRYSDINKLNSLYSGNDDFETAETRRIFFKLEQPIATNATNISQKIYQKYVEPIIQDESGVRNLYFKVKMNLAANHWEYVNGYMPLEPYSTSMYGIEITNTATIDGQTCYTHGFVTVQKAKKKNGGYFEEYHPMALAGWTYLQTNAQKLLNNANSQTEESGPVSFGLALDKIGDFLNIGPQLANSFGSIRKFCKKKGFARTIDLNHSVIRLASPDKIKFGGGHRVKQITITDNWNSDVVQESSRTYGQVYDYTITENGEAISSGVAQYEPHAGGDENPLKYPIHYYDKQNYFTNNNLFTEGPINESLFPGASVGYRKVTVKSLNTDTRMKQHENQRKGKVGGVSVHEFYTAKEFPTLTKYSIIEEPNTKSTLNLPILIPFIGSFTRKYYHASQSFLIETNDMHGKPKSVSQYELNGYTINQNPITTSIYEYQKDPINYQGEQVFRLNNYVKVIENNGSYVESATPKLMGVEWDLFTDQRENKSFHQQAGLNFNLDIPGLAFIPSVWPSFNNQKTLFRTYVTNKVIHRTGILHKTISRDLQSSNESEILAYDEKSGTPVLTKMRNEFGDDLYNYNVPAYYAYDRMGHAYQNVGMTFEANIVDLPIPDSENQTFKINIPQSINNDIVESNLFRGDEFLIIDNGSGSSNDKLKKAYFLGFNYNNTTINGGIIHVPEGLASTGQTVKFKVIRSGKRNHYASSAANYLSKGRITPFLGTNQVLNATDTDGNILSTKVIANNVLSATATLYKDDWFDGDLGYNFADARFDNPFLGGNSGIFRPYKTYSYVGERSKPVSFTSENSSSNPNLRNDGVMSNVPLFTWDIGNIEDYVQNWQWVNEITRYNSDAYELENVNRLGIYSSALYGYNNSLSIGVGGNASYYELGTIDFETSSTTWDHGLSTPSTGFNFYNNNFIKPDYYRNDVYTIKDAKVVNNVIYVHISSNITLVDNSLIQVTLNSTKTGSFKGNKGHFFNAEVKGRIGNSPYPGFQIYSLMPYFDDQTNGMSHLAVGTKYTGKLSTFNKRLNANDAASSFTQFVSNKAHTGKKSMKVDRTVKYDQYKLKLLGNKKYVLSLWVSRDNTNVSTFKPTSGNLLEVGLSTGGSLSNVTYSYGKVVEGWQKVDVEFTTPAASATSIFFIRFLPGTGNPMYVDDIRFSPKTGGIMTYVYDPVRFWLNASLNADNYATLFYYDEEGNLTLKKQETEKGIFTISESRGHVSEN